MKTLEIKTGDIFKSYYGNGDFIGFISITRVTDKSIFRTSIMTPSGGEQRESRNTVQDYLNKGMWIKSNREEYGKEFIEK